MKANNLKLVILATILAGSILSACTADESIDNQIDAPFDTPIEIQVEDYSLYGTMCNWINRKNDSKVIVINSDEELKKYVTCLQNSSYHSIDFTKHSLLLIGGTASSGIYSILEKNMQQLSSKKYELNVVVNLNEIPIPLEWNIAIRTSKLTKEASVELKVNELSASTASVIGKWKFLKEQTSGFFFPASEFDYSQHNIVYEFEANGVLTVSGNINAGWPGIGTHTYSIGNYREIFISNLQFWYQISSNELIIDGRVLDGSVFYFAKIE